MHLLQICPSTGRPCDCGAASESEAPPTSQATSSSDSSDEAVVPHADDHATSHPNGTSNGHQNGDVDVNVNGLAPAENGSCKDHSCGQSGHEQGTANGGKFASGGIPDGPKVDVLSDSEAKKVDSTAAVKAAQAPKQQWTSAVEPIFPAELRKRPPPELHLPGPYATWHR